MAAAAAQARFKQTTVITVWYAREPEAGAKKKKTPTYDPYRCQVKRANPKQGMLLDHIDLAEDHPMKEAWLSHTDPNWLIGEWLDFRSKPEAQQHKAAMRADAVRVSVQRSDTQRKDAEQVLRVMRKQESARASERDAELELFRLARSGSHDAVCAVLERGAPVHAVEPAYKCTPLMEAAANNTAAVVIRLVEAGGESADEIYKYLNSATPGGFTALHWAAMCNFGRRGGDVVASLLGSHADTMLRTKHGDTALDIAQRFKNKDVVRVLDGQLW